MRGGKRDGAGRPTGSRNAVHVTREAKEVFREILAEHEEDIARRLLATRDDRVLLGVWQLLRGYTDGKPRESVQVAHAHFSVEGILEELARRRGLLKPEPLALPAPQDTEEEGR